MSRSVVIFSGSNDRAVLAFLRVLQSCGERPYIIAWTRNDRIFKTKYRRYVVHTRDSDKLDVEHFRQYLQAVRQHVGDAELTVLPSSEYLNTFLLGNRPTIEALGCKIPLVDQAIYSRLTNKDSATDLFSENGFSVPKRYDSTSSTHFPMVAKPKSNVSADGLMYYPVFLNTPVEASAFRERLDEKNFFFQEYVSGRSFYLLFYLSHSIDHLIVYSQQNLAQQAGGKSVVMAVPAKLHKSEIAQRSLRFLRNVGFHGLGMIEFIQTWEGYTFIEMNPRIWGPIQLCVDNNTQILESFVGDMIHDDPFHFFSAPRGLVKARSYAWLGGAISDLLGRKRQTRLDPGCTWGSFVRKGVCNDVYLRRDAWRCFFYELRKAWPRGFA